jgi:hypothetical protein
LSVCTLAATTHLDARKTGLGNYTAVVLAIVRGDADAARLLVLVSLDDKVEVSSGLERDRDDSVETGALAVGDGELRWLAMQQLHAAYPGATKLLLENGDLALVELVKTTTHAAGTAAEDLGHNVQRRAGLEEGREAEVQVEEGQARVGVAEGPGS